MSLIQVVDEHFWGVHPYCSAWGNSSILGNSPKKISYGEYESGTGLKDDPMIFSGGNDISCAKPRSAEMFYECLCEEKSCNSKTAWNATEIWWGEFDPCKYSAYIFTPLACTDQQIQDALDLSAAGINKNDFIAQ